MVALYVYSFIAGLFGANGVPHFVKGVTGQKHQTPFGKGSSAAVNVAWGWANLVVAVVFLHFAHPRAHELRAFACLSIGALIMGVVMATWWTNHPEYNK